MGLSPMFDHHELAHYEFAGSFPRHKPGVEVQVPTAEHLLAMKIGAARIDAEEKFKDLSDLMNLIALQGDVIKKPQD